MAKKKVAPRSKRKTPLELEKERLETLDAERRRVAEIIRVLWQAYPDAECSLTYSTPFQLLAATILSAQCTDERVNKVTPPLFETIAVLGKPRTLARLEHALEILSAGTRLPAVPAAERKS